jgi:two-component system, sensor histidine kinase and response regulator
MPTPPLARLLIVDDEESQMKALCETLCEEGYQTTGFTSAKEALEALGKQSFDLVLTDLMMPEMSGIALLEAATQRDPELVGIVMTGQGTIETAVQAMKTGALDYILKPFKLSVVRPVLSRALEVKQLKKDKAALEIRVRERSAELEALNQELEAFSYSVSHDLRAPLRHIRSFIQLLGGEAGSLSPEGRQLLERTNESADAMDKLITNLLEFARMGRTDLHRTSISTGDLVKEVMQEVSRDAQGRDIRWEIEALPQVVADRTLLKQVLVNLVSNAVKYTRGRNPTIIRIGGRQQSAEAEFHVSDNGAGFDMRYADRLFGVFQRLHSATEFEGTGIGLASVRRIITRHGGRTWAEAKPGEGASFYFTLPCLARSETP